MVSNSGKVANGQANSITLRSFNASTCNTPPLRMTNSSSG
ncbi:Uncharacterised protein [Vibrio cholerae]|nr:Uncharacterised protein [Vibrio cholerae]CSI56834.1 Uncharacterised protein [Vibrio cholerae]